MEQWNRNLMVYQKKKLFLYFTSDIEQDNERELK